MYKIKLIKEIPKAIPKLEIRSILIVTKVVKNGVHAIPAIDIAEKPERFRREYMLYNDEFVAVDKDGFASVVNPNL